MYLKHLSLTDYRAFHRLDMDMPRRILLLVGDNAQGKTSLLESIYYLATFTSFHTPNDRQLINFNIANEALTVARLVADFQRGQVNHHIEVRLILDLSSNINGRFRKEIWLDGVQRRAHEALGTFNAVIFLPQMLRILDGSPEERRRYLNLLIAQAVPGYAQALTEYNQALTQRNALLKQLFERGGDAEQLGFWDELLARRGALIIHNRIAAVQQVEQLVMPVHRRLTHTQEILRLDYQPAYDPLQRPEGQLVLPLKAPAIRSQFSQDEIYRGFLERLVALRGQEIARGQTTIGPHRDELRFLSNQVDLGDFGSRGQMRTAMLSLKLSEAAWLKNKTGEWPVVLLDEILAELDMQRRSDLLEYLEACEQVLLTTTDLKLFSAQFIENSRVWWVEGGRVRLPEE